MVMRSHRLTVAAVLFAGLGLSGCAAAPQQIPAAFWSAPDFHHQVFLSPALFPHRLGAAAACRPAGSAGGRCSVLPFRPHDPELSGVPRYDQILPIEGIELRQQWYTASGRRDSIDVFFILSSSGHMWKSFAVGVAPPG